LGDWEAAECAVTGANDDDLTPARFRFQRVMTAHNRESGPIRSFRDLLVWQDSMDLVTAIYRTTSKFPRAERYALVDQLRRAAVSVPSNIAEGHGRSRTADHLRYLSIAVGSLHELETQIEIARRLGYMTEDAGKELLGTSTTLGRMLGGLIASLKRRLSDHVAPPPKSQLPSPNS